MVQHEPDRCRSGDDGDLVGEHEHEAVAVQIFQSREK